MIGKNFMLYTTQKRHPAYLCTPSDKIKPPALFARFIRSSSFLSD